MLTRVVVASAMIFAKDAKFSCAAVCRETREAVELSSSWTGHEAGGSRDAHTKRTRATLGEEGKGAVSRSG